jgi:hypothetical protein
MKSLCEHLYCRAESCASDDLRSKIQLRARSVESWLVRLRELTQEYRLELNSSFHRIALRSSKYPLVLKVHLVCHASLSGHPEECIRMRDCTSNIESFAASRPWATVIDWAVFRDGWEAGAQWSVSNRCSCMSDHTASAYNAPSSLASGRACGDKC